MSDSKREADRRLFEQLMVPDSSSDSSPDSSPESVRDLTQMRQANQMPIRQLNARVLEVPQREQSPSSRGSNATARSRSPSSRGSNATARSRSPSSRGSNATARSRSPSSRGSNATARSRSPLPASEIDTLVERMENMSLSFVEPRRRPPSPRAGATTRRHAPNAWAVAEEPSSATSDKVQILAPAYSPPPRMKEGAKKAKKYTKKHEKKGGKSKKHRKSKK